MSDYVLSAELSLKDRFTSKIKSAFKNSELFKRKIEETDEKLRRFGQAPKLSEFSEKMNDALQKIDQTKVKLSNLGDFKNFNQKLNEFSSNFVKKVNGIVKTGAKLLKWGAIGSTGLGIGALKMGNDFEALGARMETAFQGNKEKAAEYFKWANEFANKTPFSNEEVIDATVRLKSYGYEDPRRLMTILGDMAGAYGKTLEQSVEAYADASRGEFERLKEFGIQKAEVLKYAKETMGKEVKMSGEQVKDMDTFMKALEGLIKSRSKDGMKHLANTLSGMLSTTKGLLKYNVAKLVGLTDEGEVRAGSLMDKVKEKFENLNTYLESEEGKKAVEKWGKAFDKSLPQIIKLAGTIKDKFKEIVGENFIERLNESIKNFDPKSFNTALDKIQEKMNFLMDTVLRIGGALAGSKFGPIGTIAGFFLPEGIDAKNMVEEMNEDPNGEKAEKYKKTLGGGVFLKFMRHDDIMRQIQEQQDAVIIKTVQSIVDKQKAHQSITNNITIKIDVAITNKDDKIAYQDIANQLKSELQKTIDKTFENMTNEIEFA